MNARQPTPDIMGAVLGDNKPQHIALSQIKTNDGTQMRAVLDDETVGEYAAVLRQSSMFASPFPPIIVYYDGETYWLADGFHRVAAARLANWGGIDADVRAGNRRDAILFAAGANASHGLRRTNADKRRAVEVLLRDEEWSKWSNSEIARRCQVDEGTVRKARGDMEAASEIPKVTDRLGADGKTYNTANIGQTRPAAPQPADPYQMSGLDMVAEIHSYEARGWTKKHRWDAQRNFLTRMVNTSQCLATAESRTGDRELLIAMRAGKYSVQEYHIWERNQNPGTPPASGLAAEPVVSLDDLPVVASTGPVVFVPAPDSPPLPDWVVDEPVLEQEAAPGEIADLAMRVLNLKLWRGSFTMALKNMDLWSQATGHFTATLEAERGLRQMIDLTDNELQALGAGAEG